MTQFNLLDDSHITTVWYQQNALRTLNNFKSADELKLNAYMGIIGEYGEFFDFIKKLYTHNLNEDKKKEVMMLAPKELGDVVWYLSTSLAVYCGYTLDEIYEIITEEKAGDLGFDIDVIYNFLGDQVINEENLFSEMMRFKKTFNKLDYAENREEIMQIVAEIFLQIAEVLRDLFGQNLSAILLANIEKLRKRYPEGFSTEMANIRIDANKKYKEEESEKVQR